MHRTLGVYDVICFLTWMQGLCDFGQNMNNDWFGNYAGNQISVFGFWTIGQMKQATEVCWQVLVNSTT